MNKLSNSIGLILFLAGTLYCAAGQDDMQPERIELIANGWMLTVMPDGSAGISRLNESNAIFSTASAPPNSVDFEQIRKTLEANFSDSDSAQSKSYLQAGIRMISQNSIVLKPVRDIEIWNRLIDQLEPRFTAPAITSFKKATEKWPLKISPPKGM